MLPLTLTQRNEAYNKRMLFAAIAAGLPTLRFSRRKCVMSI
jgi:hypothetical protein